MKLAYAILHVDTDTIRESLYNSNREYLDKFAQNLDHISYGIYSKEELDNYYAKNSGLNIDRTIGFRYAEIGCWASHHSAWKKFLESDYDYVLIMEDDIKVVDGFKEALFSRIAMLPENWDMFSALVPEGNFSYFNRELHDIGSPVISLTYQGNWLGAYVLNKSGVKKLIDSASATIGRPVDIHLFYSPGLINSYSLVPGQDMYLEGIDLGTTIHNVERVEC
jgi:GR25 family glycosyltransferase involved in LPS biosynthesis